MENDELIEWAEAIGWNIEEKIDLAVEVDECSCGHDMSFIENTENARAVLLHRIQAFRQGMKYMMKIEENRPKPDYIA